MKKRFLGLLMCVAVAAGAVAQTQWTLQGNVYNVDTLNHIGIGPATTLTSLRLTGAQNLNVFYTTTDLSNPYISLKTLKAKDIIYARQTVSGMAMDHDSDSAQYFLGVNGDFYNMRRGNSISSQISDGELIFVDNGRGRTHWAVGADRKPVMDFMDVSCVVSARGKAVKLGGVNKVAQPHSLNLYTGRYGHVSDKCDSVAEVALMPIDAPISVGKTVKLRVATAPSVGGELAIPEGGYVLTAKGQECDFVNALQPGDEIDVSVTVNVTGGTNISANQLISGYPVILRNGVTTDPVDILHHLNGLHPRTAVGNDSIGTKMVILIVDGRSKVSQGCTTKVLADIMRNVGCYEAMNLDGGGSSELYVKNLGICNVPSDGKERTVANGIFAVANVPVDNEIVTIAFADFRKTIAVGEDYVPRVYGYNKYGILVDADVKGVKLLCGKAGKITAKGTTLRGTKQGSCTLTARLGKSTAEITVVVK
ncbi:MAG: phosphodiester glycosidase family protein [Muribaculaceae bacterium]|nr:phosphodiester glycosidase family protein [Muribaculaceae bacterium]